MVILMYSVHYTEQILSTSPLVVLVFCLQDTSRAAGLRAREASNDPFSSLVSLSFLVEFFILNVHTTRVSRAEYLSSFVSPPSGHLTGRAGLRAREASKR